jgi:ankyrin repeat protein
MKKLAPVAAACLYLFACDVIASAQTSMNASDYFTSGDQILFAKAAAKGDIASIESSLRKGMDVNVRGKEGMTPLLFALANQNLPGFECLLRHGANPNLQDEGGDSVISFAAIARDSAFLNLAIKTGGDPNIVNPKTGQPAIFRCIEAFNLENLKVFIAAKANLDAQDRVGDTPMAHAANINQYDLVFTLLSAGADPLIENRWGRTLMSRLTKNHVNPNSEMYQWRSKVIELLNSKGIQIQR